MENKANLVYDIVQKLLGTERENFDLDRDKYIGNYDKFCNRLSQREFSKLWHIDVWIPGSLVQKISHQILSATGTISGERILRYIENSHMVKNLITIGFIKLLLETVRR